MKGLALSNGRNGVVVLASLVLGCIVAVLPIGSGSAQQDNSQTEINADEPVNDPFEPVNRAIFQFNITLDRLVLRPVAIGYRAVLPAPLRRSVTSFWDNLESPVIFANDLLQLKPGRAGVTLSRFILNSAIGFFGFFDPALELGLDRHDEDFAQTLGHWGVGEGPYLMWPVLGPLPPRDMLGFIADSFTDPLYYILRDERPVYYGMFAADLIDQRHQVIDEVDELQKTSVDFYAAVRNLYRQSMNSEIRDGKQDSKNLPDFDYISSSDDPEGAGQQAEGDTDN